MRVLVYDASQTGRDNLWLSSWWGAWGRAGGFDHVIGVSSWEEAYREISALPEEDLEQCQYAMHGSPGTPKIAGRAPDLDRLRAAWGARLTLRSTHWWRCCDAFQGRRGQSFAVESARKLGPSVGHTRVISQAWEGAPASTRLGRLWSSLVEAVGVVVGAPWQSGGYGLWEGQIPHWSATDQGFSGPGQPHTCLATHRNPPATWWQ